MKCPKTNVFYALCFFIVFLSIFSVEYHERLCSIINTISSIYRCWIDRLKWKDFFLLGFVFYIWATLANLWWCYKAWSYKDLLMLKKVEKNFYPLALPQTHVETHVRFVPGNFLKYKKDKNSKLKIFSFDPR